MSKSFIDTVSATAFELAATAVTLGNTAKGIAARARLFETAAAMLSAAKLAGNG